MNICTLNALVEALKAKVSINKVCLSKTKRDKRIEIIRDLCRENNVVLQIVPQQVINRKAGLKNQGIFAELSPVKFYKLSEILKNIRTGLVIVLNGINDTGNMGAIIRTATAADVDGILISQRNTAPINETVLKTSAGSLVNARIVQSKNLVNDINILKENNFWVIGTDMEGEVEYCKYDFSGNTAIIFGNEKRGVSPLLKKNVDQMISIPLSRHVESLNVSVVSGIIIFEALRQKNM